MFRSLDHHQAAILTRNFKILEVCSHIKVKVKVKFTLEQVTKVQRGSRGIAVLFFNLGARWRMGGQRHAPAALPPGKDPVPIVQVCV